MSASSTHAVTRRLTLPHGLAGLQPDGTLWVVSAPADLLAAAAPCERSTEHAGCSYRGAHINGVVFCNKCGWVHDCPDCRIELVSECPDCRGDQCAYPCATMPEPVQCVEYECFCWCKGRGIVTLGYAYAVGGVLPARSAWTGEGAPRAEDQYALKLAVTPCSAAT